MIAQNNIGISKTLTNSTAVPASFAGAAYRYNYKDVILKRYAKTNQLHMAQSTNFIMPQLAASVISEGCNISSRPYPQQLHCYSSSRGALPLHLSSASTQLLSGDHGSFLHTIPKSPKRPSRPSNLTRAFREDSYRIPYPVITKKPEWWWRTLACIPYLAALQMSSTAYYVLPLLEHYEMDYLIFYIPGVIQKLPNWFPMLYFNLAYFGIVRNKDWPHFIRFHVMMGMLLETALDIVWNASNLAPYIHYKGTYAMQYWAFVGFGYILLLLECVRSAVSGRYAKIPFFSDNALIHTLFSMGRFYRPF